MWKLLAAGYIGYLLGKGKLNSNFSDLDQLLATNAELLNQLGAERIING